MRKVIGDSDFNILFKKIINYQDHIVSHYDIPLTGHFVSYRDSMINWCPIGRNATKEDRERFVNFDLSFGMSSFRRTILEQVREEFQNIVPDGLRGAYVYWTQRLQGLGVGCSVT